MTQIVPVEEGISGVFEVGADATKLFLDFVLPMGAPQQLWSGELP